MTNQGKVFEQNFADSCKELVHKGIFFYRIKDTFIPAQYRMKIRVTKNDFDSFIYMYPNLFALELKSTQDNKISFSESIIKSHQIEKLTEAGQTKGIIAGFIFNFRSTSETFFIHIEDFIKYKNIAENGLEHTYESKVNRASIPIGICREIGLEIKSVKKKVHYRYSVLKFAENAIEKYIK